MRYPANGHKTRISRHKVIKFHTSMKFMAFCRLSHINDIGEELQMPENKKLILSQEPDREISPDMIGLFFEDINFAADGGLFAELVENRSFEAINSQGEPHNYVMKEDPLYAWNPTGGTDADSLEISCSSPLNEKNPHYLRFTAKHEGDGFANKAYDGIFLKKGAACTLSMYVREVRYLKGDIVVQITAGGNVCGEAVLNFIPAQPQEPSKEDIFSGNVRAKNWTLYTAKLSVSEDVCGGALEIHMTHPGILEFDLISLIPKDAVAGVFRKDLFQALADLKPGFIRFPGGCIVEGTSLMRRYRWKDTVGDPKDRKVNTNLWAMQGGNVISQWQTPDSHYMQSYGIGFYEYFILCELLSTTARRCRPLPVLNIGVACQFRSYETVPVDSPEFEDYIQDALDLIEFANGPADSKWGSLRAKMGHPESFHLDMVAIGNEQWETPHVDLYERYRRFEKAIHQVYPDILLIGTAGPIVDIPLFKDAWDYYRDENQKNPGFVYAVDEHYYVKPEWLYGHTDFYDNYPRNIGVFAGEYACHDAHLTNSAEAALAEAAMMTGMERNGDVVRLASYAPLFNRIGHSQWTPDLIWFDAQKVVLTPSYYVQKMFSENAGTHTLVLNGQEKALRQDGLYISAVSSGNDVVLKIVNAHKEPQSLSLVWAEQTPVCDPVQMTVFKAPQSSENTESCPQAEISRDADSSVEAGKTNLEICMERFPETCICETKDMTLNGELALEGESFYILRIKVQ